MTMPMIAVLAEGGGFNPLDLTTGGGLFWTIIIFGVALVPIWKMVMGPITRALEERDDQATKAIAAAEEAKRGAESARSEVDAKLAQAHRDAARILEDARAGAQSREREMLDAAKKESAAMLERARSEIRAEQDKAIATIRRQVVDLSLNAAGTVLRRKIDASDDRRLIDEMVATVKDGRP